VCCTPVPVTSTPWLLCTAITSAVDGEIVVSTVAKQSRSADDRPDHLVAAAIARRAPARESTAIVAVRGAAQSHSAHSDRLDYRAGTITFITRDGGLRPGLATQLPAERSHHDRCPSKVQSSVLAGSSSDST